MNRGAIPGRPCRDWRGGWQIDGGSAVGSAFPIVRMEREWRPISRGAAFAKASADRRNHGETGVNWFKSRQLTNGIWRPGHWRTPQRTRTPPPPTAGWVTPSCPTTASQSPDAASGVADASLRGTHRHRDGHPPPLRPCRRAPAALGRRFPGGHAIGRRLTGDRRPVSTSVPPGPVAGGGGAGAGAGVARCFPNSSRRYRPSVSFVGP